MVASWLAARTRPICYAPMVTCCTSSNRQNFKYFFLRDVTHLLYSLRRPIPLACHSTVKPTNCTFAGAVTVSSTCMMQKLVWWFIGGLCAHHECRAGEYSTTLGRHQPTLWSDLVIHDNRAYVVDYMAASVKQYALP